MKALAFLILSFPLFSWAQIADVQTIHSTEDQTSDFDFGKVPVGETEYTFFTLTAPAGSDLKITDIAIAGDMFDASTECGDILPGGTSCDTEVDYSPTAVGEHSGQLTFATDQGNIFVNLKGEGIEPTSN